MRNSEWFMKAREKIAQGWTSGALARDVRGEEVPPNADTASCWCVTGALRLTQVNERWFGVGDLFARAAQELGITHQYFPIPTINDTFITSKEQALQWLDKAIERSRIEEASR